MARHNACLGAAWLWPVLYVGVIAAGGDRFRIGNLHSGGGPADEQSLLLERVHRLPKAAK
jgi:hypothetical protein